VLLLACTVTLHVLTLLHVHIYTHAHTRTHTCTHMHTNTRTHAYIHTQTRMHAHTFRRQQLKALVDIHGEERGMGGKLSADETKVITGVCDLVPCCSL